MSSRLVAEGVNKSFGSTRVLVDVCLEIKTSDTCTLFGPSGSGKSTLLSVLGGWLTPDSGMVEVAGRPGSGRRSLQELIAWVPQGCNSLSSRTALDNVMVGALGEGSPMSVARLEASRLLAVVGLEGRAHVAARHLSGGELQRVAIARAMAQHRPFVLADEPTGNLDRASTRDVLTAFAELSSTGVGMLIATHDEEVKSIAGRVVRVVDGTLHEV